MHGHGGKCKHPHGHRYRVDVHISGAVVDLGMVLDFAEVKRVCGRWIDTVVDHGFIVWEEDKELLEALCQVGSVKLWVIDANPTAENIAPRLRRALQYALDEEECNVEVTGLRLYETPNCWVDV